jgi:hypothetical protein
MIQKKIYNKINHIKVVSPSLIDHAVDLQMCGVDPNTEKTGTAHPYVDLNLPIYLDQILRKNQNESKYGRFPAEKHRKSLEHENSIPAGDFPDDFRCFPAGSGGRNLRPGLHNIL